MGNNKTTNYIIIIIAVVLVGGGAIWAMNRNDNKATKVSTSQTQQEVKPEEKKVTNIVTVASSTPTLSTLVTAVKAASLVETLQGTGLFTVFAPTNTAFEALPAGTLDTLLKTENAGQLKSILTYHVVSGKVLSTDLKDGQVVTTVQGEKLTISIMDGKVYIVDAKGNKAMVEKADIDAGNGVVHVINSVLLPS